MARLRKFNSKKFKDYLNSKFKIEEIVDVIVMVTQAVLMANLSIGEINAMAQAKLDRVLGKAE